LSAAARFGSFLSGLTLLSVVPCTTAPTRVRPFRGIFTIAAEEKWSGVGA